MLIFFVLAISNFSNWYLISLRSPRDQGRKFISILQAGKLEGREKWASNGKKPVAGMKSRSSALGLIWLVGNSFVSHDVVKALGRIAALLLCRLCLLVMFALYSKVRVSFPKHLSRRHDECLQIKGWYKSRGLGPEGAGNPLKAERSAFMGGSSTRRWKASSVNRWAGPARLGGSAAAWLQVSVQGRPCEGWARWAVGNQGTSGNRAGGTFRSLNTSVCPSVCVCTPRL